jgi:hypothetical protein
MNHLLRRMVSLSVRVLLLVFVVHLRAQLVTLNATSLNFGNQAITSSSSKSIRLKNTGTSPQIITSISQPGAPFLETSDCPLSPALLAPHAHCTIRVRYCPTNTARSSGLISIAAIPAAGTRTISLKGSGVEPVTFIPMSIKGGVRLCRWSGTRLGR